MTLLVDDGASQREAVVVPNAANFEEGNPQPTEPKPRFLSLKWLTAWFERATETAEAGKKFSKAIGIGTTVTIIGLLLRYGPGPLATAGQALNLRDAATTTTNAVGPNGPTPASTDPAIPEELETGRYYLNNPDERPLTQVINAAFDQGIFPRDPDKPWVNVDGQPVPNPTLPGDPVIAGLVYRAFDSDMENVRLFLRSHLQLLG